MKTILLIAFTLLFSAFVNAQDLGKIDADVQKQIGASLTNYYALSNALIDSDAEKTSIKAEELNKSFGAIDVSKMTAAQKTAWDKLEKLLRLDAKHINENKDIAHQRSHFAKLSNNMYALVFNFKANETEAYLQYCPMKKATWLSDKKDIRNPYYGNKMLDCGSVKATLKKNN
ncbi:MAG: DUF3347 domain-containing protein [Blastocatellia bacterium]|nr:DUF3347 domain-containing protein [Blastocatellia bacterium]